MTVETGVLDRWGKPILVGILILASIGLGILGVSWYLHEEEERELEKQQLAEYVLVLNQVYEQSEALKKQEAMGLPLLLDREDQLIQEMSQALKDQKFDEMKQLNQEVTERLMVHDQVLKHWVAMNQSTQVSSDSLKQHDAMIQRYPQYLILQEYRVVMVDYLVDRLADQNQLAAAVQVLEQQLERRPDHQKLQDKKQSIQTRIEAKERLADARITLQKAWVDSDYQGTLVAAEALLKLDPDQDKAHEMIRLAKHEIQRREHLQLMIRKSSQVSGAERLELIKDIGHYIKSNPDMSAAKDLLSRTQQEADKEITFNKLVEQGENLLMEGKLSASLVEFNKALQLFPDNQPVKETRDSVTQRLYVGQLLQNAVREKTLGNLQKAIALLDELLKLEPGHTDALEFREQWSKL